MHIHKILRSPLCHTLVAIAMFSYTAHNLLSPLAIQWHVSTHIQFNMEFSANPFAKTVVIYPIQFCWLCL